MNTGERIVESYFRYNRDCLTIPDIKIDGGNNRQIDLLAWNPKTFTAYHVESTIAPSGRYFKRTRSWENAYAIFQNKFFAQNKPQQTRNNIPPEDDAEYLKIKKVDQKYGFDPSTIHRIWVCWSLEDYDITKAGVDDYFEKRHISAERVEVIEFRDTIIPELQRKIGSANYEDDVLRTFSFFAEREEQIKQHTS